ncbi:Gramicidin S synthase 1 [bioreactor metagenome]|uniref:Gramicidin S synthase 1 n=1 Tax=bioreactor metagenome TaxID=1076179 RepID=A0A645GAN0_9ZZZZ
MIPSYFIQLDALPKMNNGKIDKQALLLPEKSDILRSKYIPPRNNVEKTLQRVWCNVLGLKEISINDDFFILGGDSLKAMKIVSDISRKYKINFEDVYKYSTIAELASNIIGKKSYNNS